MILTNNNPPPDAVLCRGAAFLGPGPSPGGGGATAGKRQEPSTWGALPNARDALSAHHGPPSAEVFFEEQHYCLVPHVDSRSIERGDTTNFDEEALNLEGDHQQLLFIPHHQ